MPPSRGLREPPPPETSAGESPPWRADRAGFKPRELIKKILTAGAGPAQVSIDPSERGGGEGGAGKGKERGRPAPGTPTVSPRPLAATPRWEWGPCAPPPLRTAPATSCAAPRLSAPARAPSRPCCHARPSCPSSPLLPPSPRSGRSPALSHPLVFLLPGLLLSFFLVSIPAVAQETRSLRGAHVSPPLHPPGRP